LQEGDAAINDLLAQCPEADRQQLRQLVRAGVRERQSERPPAAQRKLFKYLRELSLD
jgi:ribosome-associated protein